MLGEDSWQSVLISVGSAETVYWFGNASKLSVTVETAKLRRLGWHNVTLFFRRFSCLCQQQRLTSQENFCFVGVQESPQPTAPNALFTAVVKTCFEYKAHSLSNH